MTHSKRITVISSRVTGGRLRAVLVFRSSAASSCTLHLPQGGQRLQLTAAHGFTRNHRGHAALSEHRPAAAWQCTSLAGLCPSFLVVGELGIITGPHPQSYTAEAGQHSVWHRMWMPGDGTGGWLSTQPGTALCLCVGQWWGGAVGTIVCGISNQNRVADPGQEAL